MKFKKCGIKKFCDGFEGLEVFGFYYKMAKKP